MFLQVSASTCGAQDLPTDLFAGVLQHVPQKDQLCSHALVSSKWRHAANMATDAVVSNADLAKGLDSLSAWLASNKYIGCIHSIEVKPRLGQYSSVKPVVELPFDALRNLRALVLPNCYLKGAPAVNSASAERRPRRAAVKAVMLPVSSFAALSALSRLELDNTTLDLNKLGSCTGLKHLILDRVSHRPANIA